MSAVYGHSSYRHATTTNASREWHQTPKWHWRYWVGYRMRRMEMAVFHQDDWWIYRTYGQHARKVLEEHATGGATNEESGQRPIQSDPRTWGARRHGRQPKI